MNICVISASPKGAESKTYQTVLWLEKHSDEHQFITYHIGKSKKDRDAAYDGMIAADLVLFCYPVYTFIAPSKLHEFIHEAKGRGALAGKPYIQITTSKHFYDVTAHSWLCDNCADLEMCYLGGFSADMDDLLSKKGRKQALDFWSLVLWRMQERISLPVRKIEPKPFAYDGGTVPAAPLNFMSPDIPDKPVVEEKIAVVASLKEGDAELEAMIADFAQRAPLPVEVFNVETFPFKGSCISCFNCAPHGNCIYTDHFDKYLRGRILTARSIVYAFRIEDHSMGSRMKIYDDRQFCNGHRTVTMGSPTGFIVAGDLSGEENLRTLMRARADVGGNFLAGIATSKSEIEALAKTLGKALKENITQPQMFLGIGGMKIFRDLIWMMQGLMRADHHFFKSHGQYDFPQNRRGDMLKMYLIGALMNNSSLKKKAGSKISEGMIGPYKKALESKE